VRLHDIKNDIVDRLKSEKKDTIITIFVNNKKKKKNLLTLKLSQMG
jgi:hypothetical protein